MSEQTEQKTDAERLEALMQDPEVAAAVQAAKASIAAQCQPFGIEPEAYVVEACGLPCVLLPWQGQKRMLAVRACAGLPQMEMGFKMAEAVVVDCLFWIKGQRDDGRSGALKHARGLVDLVGGRYMNLILAIGTTFLGLVGEEVAAPVGGKK